jgi:hypothetical protein
VLQSEQPLASANDEYIISVYHHNLAKLTLARAIGLARTSYNQASWHLSSLADYAGPAVGVHLPTLNGTDAAVLSHMMLISPLASVMSVNSHVS